MKLGLKRLGLAGLLIAVIWFWISSPLERQSPYDWTEFDNIEKELIHYARTGHGLYCFGTGGSAPGGVIRSWYLCLQRYGIPNEDEALKQILAIREAAATIFDQHPKVLSQMDPDWQEPELFEIEIMYMHYDGSEPDPNELSRISLRRGSLKLESGDFSHRETIVLESYADFLARFPDTKLKAIRDGQ